MQQQGSGEAKSFQSLTDIVNEFKQQGWQNYFFIPHMLANLTTIIICFLSYGVYVLLDEYLHTILISLLVGTSLKPIKNAFVTKLLKVIYRVNGEDGIYEPLFKKLRKTFLFNSDPESAVDQQVEESEHIEDFLQQAEGPQKQSLHPNKIPRKLKSPKRSLKPRRKDSSKQADGFSTLEPTKLLNQERTQPRQTKQLTKTQKLFWVLWETGVISLLVFIFYMVHNNIGLVVLFTLLVGEYAIGVTFQFFSPVIRPLLRLMFAFLQVFCDKENLKKYLSKFLSVLFIFLVLAMIILTIVFSVIWIQKDIMNIKEGISEDFIKKDFMNYSTHFHKISVFFTELNLTQSLNVFLPQNSDTFLQKNMMGNCIKKVNSSYLLALIPQFISRQLCNLYVKFDYNTLQNYYPFMRQAVVILSSVVGVSFSSVYGLFNFIFIFWFKIIMFLSTTYYIVEDFNLSDMRSLFNRFVSVNKSRSNKITYLFFQIKNIMFGSVKISFLHFLLTWIVFDFFQITNFNFIISLFLGFMALVPIYHPFIGALLVLFCSWMYKPQEGFIKLILISVFYLSVSYMIFNITYARISMPSIITNLSVILGVYSFGVLGIVYGPILVTIFRCILSEFKTF